MKKYLFLFTISPVQSFIAQARKTQDLYVGSQLLSDLIKAGAREFENQKGKLIFPNTNAQTFTNRFLGKIETDNPKEIGKEIEQAVRNILLEKANNAVKNVIGNKKLSMGFKEQIENLLDIKWAFVEWNGEAGTYKEAYDKIEKIIGAIKNVRTFK